MQTQDQLIEKAKGIYGEARQRRRQYRQLQKEARDKMQELRDFCDRHKISLELIKADHQSTHNTGGDTSS